MFTWRRTATTWTQARELTVDNWAARPRLRRRPVRRHGTEPLLVVECWCSPGPTSHARTDARGLPVGSDSYLTAEEVMGLDLSQTELVVLSACQTGTGKVRNGKGVFSLQRAFHVGGSRTVVATLWSIPDQPTQVLMERFYTNMWQKKMGKFDALKEAQQWMLREGRSHPGVRRGLDLEEVPLPGKKDGRLPPYSWAGFVLSGDWR